MENENQTPASGTPAEHMTGNVLTAVCPVCRTSHSGPHCPRYPYCAAAPCPLSWDDLANALPWGSGANRMPR